MEWAVANIGWLQGPPLLPDYISPLKSEECGSAGCPDPLRIIILSALFHVVQFVVMFGAVQRLWFWRNKSFADQITIASYLVSTTHAVIVAYGSVYAVYLADIPLTQTYFARNVLMDVYLGFSIGYFWYDFSLLHVFHSILWEPPVFLHHAICAIVFPLTFVFFGVYLPSFMLVMEASTPFVNLRWILSNLGLKSSRLYTINGITMVIVFILVRPVLFCYFYYRLYVSTETIRDQNPFFIATVTISLSAGAALNYYWSYKMVSGILSVLGKKDRKIEKDGKKEKKDS
eukprot:m.774448 g.774448  ORF g.774448 m.774448 type:complete len:287 (+) comp59105_c0_seq6:1-861(+)